MKYDGFLKRVAKAFEGELATIEAFHNFEYGPEFEVALCRVLRQILPQRFGICRGYAVCADSQRAGDDIVIYDRETFPVLRFLPQDSFATKEGIPIEAVYAYIEAKHTLCLSGTGSQSLWKAASQVAAVKALPRPQIPPEQIGPYLNLQGFKLSGREEWPKAVNPLYGAILAKQVRLTEKDEPTEDVDRICELLGKAPTPVGPQPDAIVAGPWVSAVPGIPTDKSNELAFISPFIVDGRSELSVNNLRKLWPGERGLGFAVGISLLLYALDTIRLGSLPWRDIISEGVGVTRSG